jgi:hypothetical protein
MISDKAMKVLWEEGITKDQVLDAIADIPLAKDSACCLLCSLIVTNTRR